MTPILLLSLLCCLMAVAALLIAGMWRRDARHHAAERSEAEQRERDAASQLAASAAHLAAAEQQTAEARETLQRQEERLTALTEERMRTETELAALRASSAAEIETLRRQNAEQTAAYKAEREATEERFRAQFKNLATEILGEQSQHFRQTSRESIDLMLKPFRDNITDFRKRVEEIYTTQTSQRGELKAELKQLMELNRTISTEAQNLTSALKGNSKVQGDWGEMLLETILDSSALTRGIHYETQYNIKDEEGRNLRPDVVLHLPEKKDIVIDSKVSLTAFVAYTSAETEAERQRHLAAHVASVRQHVIELGRKEYQRRLNSPDFVIMFIPNEPAFLAALQNDTAIWSDAYDKKVIISSPTDGRRPVEIQRSGQEHEGDRRLRAEALRAARGLHFIARECRCGARQGARRLRGCPQAPLHGQRQHHPRGRATAAHGAAPDQAAARRPHARGRGQRRRGAGRQRRQRRNSGGYRKSGEHGKSGGRRGKVTSGGPSRAAANRDRPPGHHHRTRRTTRSSPPDMTSRPFAAANLDRVKRSPSRRDSTAALPPPCRRSAAIAPQTQTKAPGTTPGALRWRGSFNSYFPAGAAAGR